MPEMSAADELVAAVHLGDVDWVERLVASDSGLASSPLGGTHGTRTPLHVVTDWPGYWPNGPQIVRILLAAGANPNTRDTEPRSETPLHWAASNDDADVARVLIDGGADINVADGSIGAPLDNAVGYGCWNVARLLVERGARVENLWVAAALGWSIDSKNSCPRDPKPTLTRCLRRFGTHATLDSGGPRSSSSVKVLT